mmetsp:Transcript_18056/g.25623  ORF Transcript_18056/g.25623 Transcript_18056/m.25623 type:complete len:311 (+) Transcript_18056:157-1089(+)
MRSIASVCGLLFSTSFNIGLLFRFRFINLLDSFLLGVLNLFNLLAHEVVHNSTANITNLVLALKERKETDNNGGTESPSDGHKNPEGKVRLSEHLSRDREDRPHNDKHEGEEVSTTDNPALGTTDLILVNDVLGETGSIFCLNKMDVGIKSSEVKILRIDELGVHIVDQSRTQNGNQVSTEHDRVRSESAYGDGSTFDGGSNKPGNEGKDESTPGSNDGSLSRCLVPSHHVPERDNSRSNNNTHEEIHPSKVKTHGVECNRKETHEDSERHNHNTRYPKNLLSSCFGVDVLTVNIVGNQGRHGNRFGRSS